ncbi:predicted protein [Arabidopsis lyrata subsp. lyrata]|uniref:Predicted protein n=1 Tax=Arabidopsis lyrata subsp. lyrata TaxID=81972 RepID=D7KQW1_ARALL|nr:predicted protein [Arabidopsis lyrata subsp. lyrata]
MFDFRHGGSNQKLLMDKKRGSKRIIGNNGMFETKVEKQLTCDFFRQLYNCSVSLRWDSKLMFLNQTTNQRDIESEIEVSQEGKVQGKAERIITTLKFEKEEGDITQQGKDTNSSTKGRVSRDRDTKYRVVQVVATCNGDLKRRIQKIPGVPIMYVMTYGYPEF